MKSSTKSELLRLAQILQRDKTPKLTHLPTSTTSEGESSISVSQIDQIPQELYNPLPKSSSEDATVKTSNKLSQSSIATSEGGKTIQQNYSMPTSHLALYSTPLQNTDQTKSPVSL